MAGAAARRYARAIFELASEQGQIEEWAERLKTVREVFGVPEVQAVLVNPAIPLQRRQEAVRAVLDDRIGPEGVNLAKLLVGAGRVDELDDIIEQYNELADEAAGRVKASVTTAVELTPEESERLSRELSRRFGREVRLTANVDPAVIGGLVLQVGDRVVDASIATRLRQLRRKLASA